MTQNDRREQRDETADMSFADILKEFESTSRETRRPAREGKGKGRGKGRPSPQSRQGTVVGISGASVLIDYGAKSEGIIPAADLKDAKGELTVMRGDTFNVAITGFNKEGMATLSRI